MARKSISNGVLLLLVAILAIFAFQNYNSENEVDKSYYYEFSDLDLTNATFAEVVNGEEYESLRVSNYSGTQTYVLDANQDFNNVSKFVLEVKVDVSEIEATDSVSLFVSMDHRLVSNQTNIDNLDFTNVEDYLGSFVRGRGLPVELSDNIAGARLNSNTGIITFTYEIDGSQGNDQSNNVISRIFDNETFVAQGYAIYDDLASTSPFKVNNDNKVLVALLGTDDGSTPVELGTNSSYTIDSIRIMTFK